MKAQSIIFALLLSVLLATVTPPVFTTTAGPTQKTMVYQPSTDSAHVTDSIGQPPDDQDTGGVINPGSFPPADPNGLWGLGIERVLAILAGAISLLLMLFPTKSGAAWYKWISYIIFFIIPNFKDGGGTHSPNLFVLLWNVIFPKRI